MTWGGLNPALTAWRNAYVSRLPGRGTASDGARADAQHGSASQHQEDPDGTVDANDMDANVLGSGTPTGTPEERRLIEAMKLDFERDPRGRGQLWIHDAEIANRDIGNWRERPYSGAPHDKHVHWESKPERERDGSPWPMPHTDALLEEMSMPNAEEIAAAVAPAVWKYRPWSSPSPISAADAVQQASKADEALTEAKACRADVARLEAKIDQLLAQQLPLTASLAQRQEVPPAT